MEKIVLATGNPHKVEELRGILSSCGAAGVEFLGLADAAKLSKNTGPFEEPHEHGRTFEENATIKALSYAQQTGMPCLADDSGLEVDVLGGKPGVISSHYCTDGEDVGMSRAERDAANNRKVLMQMEEAPWEKRGARFVCVMVLAHEGRALASVRGEFEGRIGVPPAVPRGLNGFGYDPLFLVGPDFARTGAELSPQEKNKVSHRARAAVAMAEQIRGLSH
jgi:XTP/dITP diphosphohydrolase